MKALRSIAVFLWMAITVIPFATVLLILSLFVGSVRLWWWVANPWLRLAIGATRLIGGIQYTVTGMENLPAADDNQRIILCPKHQSTWETFFFPSMMPHPLAYVFKRELLFIPFFGWAMARLEMVHIDRSARSEAWNKVAKLGTKLMDRGKWIIMFPEGTRTTRGGQGVYKTGASRLALATGARIVPIAVSSGRCWPSKTWTFIPGTIEVSIGPIIEPAADESAADLMGRVESWIEQEMRRIDPDAYPDQESAADKSLSEDERAKQLAAQADAARTTAATTLDGE